MARNASGGAFPLLRITQKGSVPYEIDPYLQCFFCGEGIGAGQTDADFALFNIRRETRYFSYKAIIWTGDGEFPKMGKIRLSQLKTQLEGYGYPFIFTDGPK